jgi:hypothetical protein
MRTLPGYLVVAIFVIALPMRALGTDKEDAYFADIAAHFQDSTAVLQEILAEEIDPEDLPVCFVVARETNSSAQQIAQLRKQGDSWADIMRTKGMSPRAFYFIVAVDFDSKTYSPLFAKYTTVPQSEWPDIVLSDEDVVNLVNLKFIYRRHGYSVFEVMAMRDIGKSFPTINQQIARLKQELMRKEREEKKKKESETAD